MSFSAPQRQTSGSVSAGHVAAYGALRAEKAYVSGGLAFNFYGNEVNRVASLPGVILPLPGGPVAIPGITERLNGRFNSQSISGYVETGYRYQMGSVEMTPYAALQFGTLFNNKYAETIAGGPSVLGLTYAARTIFSAPTFLGLQLKTQTDLFNGMVLSAWARMAWKHEWSAQRSTRSSFATASGFDFIINGATPTRDALRASLGMKLQLDQTVAITGNFDGDFARRGRGYTGTAGIRVNW